MSSADESSDFLSFSNFRSKASAADDSSLIEFAAPFSLIAPA